MGVWIAAVRLPTVLAAVAAGAITAALAVAVGLSEQHAAHRRSPRCCCACCSR